MSARQILIGLDQLANTLAGGMADETLSARAWRIELAGGTPWPRRIIDTLFAWKPNHCRESWLAEIQRKKLPEAYRSM